MPARRRRGNRYVTGSLSLGAHQSTDAGRLSVAACREAQPSVPRRDGVPSSRAFGLCRPARSGGEGAQTALSSRSLHVSCHASSWRWPHSADISTKSPHLVATGGIRHPGALYNRGPMKTVRHTTTLFYYDGPQVFEARDAIGGHYVAVMVEPEHGKDRYLVVGVEPERLRQFRAGLLDLRTLLAERGEAEWHLTTVEDGLNGPLTILPQTGPLAAS